MSTDTVNPNDIKFKWLNNPRGTAKSSRQADSSNYQNSRSLIPKSVPDVFFKVSKRC